MRKVQIFVSDDFYEHLETIRESNPGFNNSQIIRLGMRLLAETGVEFGFTNLKIKTLKAMESRKATSPKEDWCGMFGGELKDGVCDINKYEVLPSGHVQKLARSIAVSAFPPDRDDFKRQVLGHYEDIEAAEEAYKLKPLH